MIGVGLEELGLAEFQEGGFFEGELFLDIEKKSYQAMGFKRMGFLEALRSVLTKKGRETINSAKALGIQGNIKGDALQNGGTIVVAAGGKALLTFVQDHPADHVEPEDVLKALNIEGPLMIMPNPPKVTCDDQACSVEK